MHHQVVVTAAVTVVVQVALVAAAAIVVTAIDYRLLITNEDIYYFCNIAVSTITKISYIIDYIGS